jgi:hypothetical protein
VDLPIENGATLMNIIAPVAPADSAAKARIARYSWPQLADELNSHGCAVLEKLLTPDECRQVAALYPQESHFRSHVHMARHGFGKGEYRYFRYPLPEIIGGLRTALYPRLAEVANEWADRMSVTERYPAEHAAFLAQCHAAGQTRPTPLLLQYVPGDFNCLHQDLYGDLAFPIQVAILLSEPGLLLHVGRLVEKKGTALLLDAMVEIRKHVPAARLAVIGEGPLGDALRARSARLGLDAHVEWLGRVPHDAVRAWMRRATLLAVPSITARDGDAEGLPTVIPEAGAAGLPTVGSDHSGIPEAVIDGKTGFVVPEGDSVRLAGRIIELLGDPARAAALGVAARALVEEQFDSKRQTERLEHYYAELIAEGARARARYRGRS